jgi:hypothetical protein
MTARTPIWAEGNIAIIRIDDSAALAALTATLPTPEPVTYVAFDLLDPAILKSSQVHDWDGITRESNGADLYGVTVNGTLVAIIDHDTSLYVIRTLGAPLRQHPQFAFIHYAYINLAERLHASIALKPAGPLHPYLVTPHGEQLPPDPAYAEHAAYGTVILTPDASLDDLDLLLRRKYLTLDITALPQHMLDTIRSAEGSLYSNARHVLLRHLRQARNLILPLAEMVILPVLCEVRGTFLARMANYADARRLDDVGFLSLPKLQYADFPALTRASGDIHLPMARNAAFPALRHFKGAFHVPRRTKIFAPRLPEVNRSHTNAPLQMMEEMELCSDRYPEHLVFLNLTA